MKNLHLIEVKYLSATNTKGSRVKLTSHRFHVSKIIIYNYSFNSIADIAIDYLKKQGHLIIGKGELIDGNYMLICKADKDSQFLELT